MSMTLFRVLVVAAFAVDAIASGVVARFAPSGLLITGILVPFATTIGLGVASFYVKK